MEVSIIGPFIVQKVLKQGLSMKLLLSCIGMQVKSRIDHKVKSAQYYKRCIL
jgi:hypothetical protein